MNKTHSRRWRSETVAAELIHIERFGGASAPYKVLFLHGGPGMDCSYFKGSVEQLAGIGELILYTHGQAGRTSIAMLVEELDCVVSSFPANSIFVVAHSFGGALVLEWLRRTNNNSICGLILVSQITSFPWNSLSKERHRTDLQEFETSLLSAKGLQGDDLFKHETLAAVNLYFSQTWRGIGRIALSRVQYNEELKEAIFRDYLKVFDLEACMSSMSLPCLVITGTDDPIVDPEHSRKAAEIIPSATYVSLAGTRHFPFVEESELFSKAVSEFIGKVLSSNTQNTSKPD